MKRVWFGIGVACIFGAAAACNPFAPDQSVVLGVEKIDAPATSPVGSPLTVVLTVIVGGCKSFDHIEAVSVGSGAALTAWGQDGAKGKTGVLCPADIVFEPHSYQFDPPARGAFQITVDRGRLSPLTATVQVQ